MTTATFISMLAIISIIYIAIVFIGWATHHSIVDSQKKENLLLKEDLEKARRRHLEFMQQVVELVSEKAKEKD